MTRSLGEAYFLRAHYYFILVRCFGGVPIRTEPAKVSDPKDIARNTVTEVYDLIIKDCKEAIERLPQKNELAPADLGRATKDAACTQLAKVYLTLASYGNTYASLAPEEGFYQAVVDLCDEIATMGYDLAACDYASLWNENLIKNKNSAESIFEIQYSGENAGTGGFWANDGQSSWCSTFIGLVTLDLLMALMGGINLLMNSLNRMKKVINVKILPYFMKDVRILMESPIRQVMLL